MKKVNTIKKYVPLLLAIAFLASISGCDTTIADFGYDGQISGTITDQSGNIVSGDITVPDLTVFALGEEDIEPMQMRVKGDGTFGNNKLYPQSYEVWVEGPVDAPDPVTVDLSGDPVQHDITVTPFLIMHTPELDGSPSSNEVSVSYEITESSGHIAEERIVYVSTGQYPSQSTGSGITWHTRQASMDDNEGTVTVDDLESGTRYYVRIAARAEGTTLWNLSDQIEIETP